MLLGKLKAKEISGVRGQQDTQEGNPAEKISKPRKSNRSEEEGRRVTVKGKDQEQSPSSSNPKEARESNSLSNKIDLLEATVSDGSDERQSKGKERDYWNKLSSDKAGQETAVKAEPTHSSEEHETAATPSPNSDGEAMLVNVTYPSDINVIPKRRVLVQEQDRSAKESEEIEVIYNKKTHRFKVKEEIKKEANEESGSSPSTTATGQERSATSNREGICQTYPA
jgi:hypothetical protein